MVSRRSHKPVIWWIRAPLSATKITVDMIVESVYTVNIIGTLAQLVRAPRYEIFICINKFKGEIHMFYTIYKVTNLLNGKIYIGKHQTKNLNDSYLGSGKLIKAAIRKHGKENFAKEVLFIFETELEMNEKEKELITEDFVLRKDTYNAGIGGEGGPHFKGKQHGYYMKEINGSEDHRKKISDGLKKYYENGTVWNKGCNISEDQKKSISNKMVGRKHSDETKMKIKAARASQVISEETKKKMTESAKNRKK